MFCRSLVILPWLLSLAACATVKTTGSVAACSQAEADAVPKPPGAVRFATFNVALFRSGEGELLADLERADDQRGAGESDAQTAALAEILQRVRPDVLLLNEFDYDEGSVALARFQRNFLEQSQRGLPPLRYAETFLAPSNTGVQSGLDLDGDGVLGGPLDAYGYGRFPGQYAMAVLSRFPIEQQAVRSFQRFRWRDMPGALIPEGYFSAEAEARLRLSSKSHWDVPIRLPIRLGGRTVHVLAAHPTPPGFDGPEDRNGRRNYDEIRLWADYLGSPAGDARYLYDDNGQRGGLAAGEAFVILGDYNADPLDGTSRSGAITQLLTHPRVNASMIPASPGGAAESRFEGKVNAAHLGNPAFDTIDLDAGHSGNLRLDYALPSKAGLETRCAGVFWPTRDSDQRELVGDGAPVVSSDHRLVWVDVVPTPVP